MAEVQNNIINNFISALEEELISVRKRSTEESISLQDGERTTSTSDKTIYTFFIEEDLKAIESTKKNQLIENFLS